MDRLIKRKGEFVYLAIADNLSKEKQEIESSREVLEGLYATWQKLADYEDLGTIDEVKEALEKQAFFENEVAEIRSWFINNKDMILDSAYSVASMGFDTLSNNYDLIDKVDLDTIVEDIVDEIQKGILNVLSTYTD